MPPLDPDDDDLDQDSEDDSPPFSPPSDPGPADATDPDDGSMADDNRIDDTHPDTDDGMEDQEVYDAGNSAAAGASEPNAGNTVVGYDPAKDKRKTP